MKKCFLLLFVAAVPFLSPAQVALFVSPGTALTIRPSTVFSAAGLTLVPSSAYTINNVSLSRTASLTHSSANASILRSYSFSSPTPAFSGFYQINYLTSELNGLPELLLQPNVNNGTYWQAYPGAYTDVFNHFVVSSSFSSTALSEMTLAGISTPLPVSWGRIGAVRKNLVNEISWSAEKENGVDHFLVEYSTDAGTWTSLPSVVQASDLTGPQQYRLTDDVYKPQYLLYRVAAIDADGRVSFSATASLPAVGAGTASIGLYPNPTSDRFYLSLPEATTVTEVKLFSSAGLLVRQWREGQTEYGLAGIARGVYIVSIKTKAGLTQNLRLVIR